MDGERGIADGEENEELFKMLGAVGGTNTQVYNSNWKPDKKLLDYLISMGVSEKVAKNALFYTMNESLESAINWIFEMKPDENTILENKIQKWNLKETDKNDINKNNFKMVFVVNSSLNMGVGKICAQVAHASLGLFRLLIEKQDYASSVFKWIENGETKIVLKAYSTKCLVDLEKEALSKGLATYLVSDAGRTQVEPGSITVLSIFGTIDNVSSVTGKLKLL